MLLSHLFYNGIDGLEKCGNPWEIKPETIFALVASFQISIFFFFFRWVFYGISDKVDALKEARREGPFAWEMQITIAEKMPSKCRKFWNHMEEKKLPSVEVLVFSHLLPTDISFSGTWRRFSFCNSMADIFCNPICKKTEGRHGDLRNRLRVITAKGAEVHTHIHLFQHVISYIGLCDFNQTKAAEIPLRTTHFHLAKISISLQKKVF